MDHLSENVGLHAGGEHALTASPHLCKPRTGLVQAHEGQTKVARCGRAQFQHLATSLGPGDLEHSHGTAAQLCDVHRKVSEWDVAHGHWVLKDALIAEVGE